MNATGEINQTTIVLDWLATHIGGTVTSLVPQLRWRPQWFVDIERDGETLALMVRGDRRDTRTTWPLHHEMRFQELLHDQGMNVPRVYGWIAELPGFVTDRVAGQPNFAGTPDDQRATVIDEYLEALAAVHRLDVAPFIEAGIDHADDADGAATIGMRRMEAMFRSQKVRPDPFMEFCLGWFHRHEPVGHGRQGPVVWDSGQFHHHDGHLTGLLDLELGHIGDPMMDLAGWRMRDSIIGFGDFGAIYARYEAVADAPVDLEAIQLHHIAFTFSNQLAFSHALKDPPPGSDFATNLQWCNETNLYATEAIAEYLGAELPTVEPIEARRSPVAAAHTHLVRALRSVDTADEVVGHQLRTAFRLARHLARFDEIGDAAVAADLDDIHVVLGRRPEEWTEGEEELERFVLADATVGRRDEDLLWLFHRRNLRAQMLNGPAGSAMARHLPIQPFGRPTPAAP